MNCRTCLLRCAAVAMVVMVSSTFGNAATVDVTGGRTSVALDTKALSTAAGLTLSGTSPEVQSPGDLENSVAFPITARDAAERPTTFSYDPADFLNTFSGTIEHAGTVSFNENAVTVGNFTIGYDADRAGTLTGLASGFYVRSNTDVDAILFDVGQPAALNASETLLALDADLLVSPEFGQFLLGGGLATSDLSGVDVGDARIAASATGSGGGTVIPLPPGVVPGLIGLAVLAAPKLRRRMTSAG
jgi:hypothetical protein